MRWIYKGQILNTLTIPFYLVGAAAQAEVRLVSDETEILERSYLCLVDPTFVGSVQAKIKGSEKWYDVGGLWDTDCFIGTLPANSFQDLLLQFTLPGATESGPYRLPFLLLHGDRDHGPNRNFCAYNDDEPLWGDDDLETPLWTGSQGRCPFADIAGSCDSYYGRGIPSEDLPAYTCVVAYTENGKTMIKAADPDTLQNATVVGIMAEHAILMPHAVGAAQYYTEDGLYIYEHGGQEVDSSGNLLDVWHPEVRVFEVLKKTWIQLGICGEDKQRDHTIVQIGDILYIYGGNNGARGYYSSLYAFDLVDLTCTQLEDAPEAVSGANAIVEGAEIHIIDGWLNDGTRNDNVYIYNILTDTWSIYELPNEQLAPPSIYPFAGFPSGWSNIKDILPSAALVHVCYGNRYWVLTLVQTGFGSTPTYAYQWQSFPSWTKGWVTEATVPIIPYSELDSPGIPLPGVCADGIVYNGKIYIYKSALSTQDNVVHMWTYDIATKQFTMLSGDGGAPLENSGSGRSCNGCGLYGNKIYYWFSCPEYSNDKPVVAVFNCQTGLWERTLHEFGEGYEQGAVVGTILGNKFYYSQARYFTANAYGILNLNTWADTSLELTIDWPFGNNFGKIDRLVALNGNILVFVWTQQIM